jgi:DNA-binding transcriptional regulator YhcF (GntR family)
MSEDIIFKRRHRLKRHFVNTSSVLLCGYKFLSDGAKQTYQVIDSLDWENKETGDSKGYVFPAIKTIAEMRSKNWRTVYRQIEELEAVGLLTRQRRRNMPSVLMIEDVSDEEANLYIEKFIDKGEKIAIKSEAGNKNTINSTIVKNDNSQKAPQLSKMTIAYMKEYEYKENEINVNENLKISERPKSDKKRGGMQGLNDILKRFDPITQKQPPSMPKNPKKPYTKLTPDEKAQRDYLAQEMAETLGDQKSLGAFRTIAQRIPEIVIRDCLASVKETWRDGKIKQSRGALFISIIQQYSQKKQIPLFQ